jgi:lysophospholipase L1-like esterase
MDGKTYYHLVPDYTNDGGHLNETGRKLVAEQLLLTIAAIL